jgi:hypothetical protein
MALALAACVAPARAPAVRPPPSAPVAAVRAPELAALKENDRVAGFVARALYVDGDYRPRGARLVHEATGFVFDYLAIESAPQAMLYVSTYPTSDRGEPHTQEHLLIGRGNEGRRLGNVKHASFSRDSAFTASHRTVYHFHTEAGPDSFWEFLRTYLHAMLHPDASDEEIRREDSGRSRARTGIRAATDVSERHRARARPRRVAQERVA